jgi:hypothetical protein
VLGSVVIDRIFASEMQRAIVVAPDRPSGISRITQAEP